MPYSKNCIICKGSNPQKYCNRNFCPLISKSKIYDNVREGIQKNSFSGNAPAPFIGRHNYPNVNVGILSTTYEDESSWEYDFPKHWAQSNYDEEKIMGFRTGLVNSRMQSGVKSKNEKIVELAQDVAMALVAPEIEISLQKAPSFSFSLDTYSAPTGPVADMKSAEITSNIKTSPKIERVIDDTDLKAGLAMNNLYEKKFDENTISKILSVGSIGIGSRRKLVPTRWSITATDDILCKKLITGIKSNDLVNEYMMYSGDYMGNYYYIMFLPSNWSFELYETYASNASFNQTGMSQYTTDYENYNGRKDYAAECTGGYYAVRLPVAEKLKQLKRQAGVLIFRFITDEYAMPLGVWVCRETARRALKGKPLCFDSKEQMLDYAKKVAKIKFGYDVDEFIKKSRLLKEIRAQSRLNKWM
ncbi:MAG: hypothetical protein DRN66_01645 [Candidatus Nanohalarchaeota archaeon]|nr:MAG: hypothetical protein DRN66_01645 [Candidatus Nanohaloarchaeota archaeon]